MRRSLLPAALTLLALAIALHAVAPAHAQSSYAPTCELLKGGGPAERADQAEAWMRKQQHQGASSFEVDDGPPIGTSNQAPLVPGPGGDLLDDGVADLLVGAPGYDAGGLNAGTVYLIEGSSSLASGSLYSAAWLELQGTAGDEAGTAVGTVDLDQDGQPDFIVGAPGYDNGSTTDMGRFFVVSGSYGALGGTASLGGSATKIISYSSTTAGSARLGEVIAPAGDLISNTSTPYPDAVIGAPDHDSSSSSLSAAGAVWVLAGNASLSLVGTQALYEGSADGDHLGTAVAGDFDYDGDGEVDLAVGAPGVDYSLSKLDTGAVYLLQGPLPAGTYT